MKTFLTILLFVALTAQAQTPSLHGAAAEAKIKEEQQDFVPRDPWRAIDGQTNYVKIDGVEFCGRILEVQPNGVRIKGKYGELFKTYYSSDERLDYLNEEFFVANFPFEVAEDEVISRDEHLMAWYVGTYTYTTTQGGSRTIRKLDYGIPCNPPAELIQKQIEAAKAKAALDKKRAEEGQINAVKWLQSQATNGDASAQCSLGLHYLNGQGCETNQEQAIFWLTKAAAQGNLEASNKLATLKIQ